MGQQGDVADFGGLSDDDRAVVLNRLAAEAAAGDARALDDLLSLVDGFRLARGAIRGLIVNDADADDVAQDVLIKVSSGISSFRGDSKFTSWLYTVARNCAIGHLRRSRNEVALNENDLSPSKRVSSLIASRGDLHRAIDDLPDHYREAVILRDIEGFTYESIAQRVGIEIGTVRSRLARGRALVARSLDIN